VIADDGSPDAPGLVPGVSACLGREGRSCPQEFRARRSGVYVGPGHEVRPASITRSEAPLMRITRMMPRVDHD
jgi:hypothetical protein